MSTGYSWEDIRQVRATLLGARHVPERLCGGYVYLGRYNKCSTFTSCCRCCGHCRFDVVCLVVDASHTLIHVPTVHHDVDNTAAEM